MMIVMHMMIMFESVLFVLRMVPTLLLRKRSVHLEILGLPLSGAF